MILKKVVVLNVFIEIINRFSILLISLILAKGLTVESFGLYTLMNTTISMGQTVIDFGSQNFAVKSIIQNKSFIRFRIILTAFKYRIVGFLVWVLFVFIYTLFSKVDSNFVFYIIWGSIYLFNSDWIFKGLGYILKQTKVFTIFNLIALFVIYIYFKTQNSLSYEKVIYIVKIFPLLLGSIFLIKKLNDFKYPLIRICKNYFKNFKFNKAYFVENSYFSLGGILARVYNSSGLLILGVYISIEEIGILSYSFLVFTIFSMARGIIISTLFPYICDLDVMKLKKIITNANFLVLSFYCLILFTFIIPFLNDFLELLIPSSQPVTPLILSNFNLCFLLIGINCFSFFNISGIQSASSGKVFTFLMGIGIIVMITSLLVLIYLGFASKSLFIALILAELFIALTSYFILWKK